ncbi:DNA-directed RNA polymerase I subunit RPA43 [Lucilia sericata]|uniref:DNA-directed RNA polymerase I subunit RPA43 n=1 Tax=Lucilia sericata TaxID=13632 RepID=UPI0018A86EF2|nr:DNA-directed RNA polymerase I subunit RPA43 [Lucilia sericata]
MAKRLQEYVKYTTKELDQYTETEGSCVLKINTNLHLSMGPFCLADFKHVLMAHLVRSKVGFYDIHLDGIVLDVKNIKVLGNTGAMRADDARIHVNINADVYVFRPEEGAELTGVVKHIGPHQVGVILYRVFNANLRVAHKVDKEEVQMDQEVKFRIRKYNLQNVFPYIDGELLTPGAQKALAKAKKIVFKQEENADSGIEEKDGGQELDDLLSVIKTEAPSEFEEAIDECNKQKPKKSKKSKNTAEETPVDSDKKKSSKKRKSSQSSGTESSEIPVSKEIKRELTYSDDSLPPTPKKIKKEKEASSTKKHKSKSSDLNVKVKSEIVDDDCYVNSV